MKFNRQEIDLIDYVETNCRCYRVAELAVESISL